MATEINSARAPRHETPAYKRTGLDAVIEYGSAATVLALCAGLLLVLWGGSFLMANDSRHGTITGYRYGCRCRKCIERRIAYNLGVGGRSNEAERKWREKLARESGTPSLERLMESATPTVVGVYGVGKVGI